MVLEGKLRAFPGITHVVPIDDVRAMLKFDLNGISFDLLFVSLLLSSAKDLSAFPMDPEGAAPTAGGFSMSEQLS